jgi:membrane-associated protease RseP (regulator of RpoE activity)
MRPKAMDHSFIRGAAAAFLVVAVVPDVRAQSAGAAQARPARDTFFVRTIEGDKAKIELRIDSLMMLMRAFETQPALSDEGLRLRREFEMVARGLAAGRGPAKATFFFNQPLEARRLRGWIGIEVGLVPQRQETDSSGFFVRYYRYPEIISVEPNSPAQRAGISQGDVLMAYDGQDVVRNRLNLAELLVPDRKLGVTVQREGESKEFSLTVAKTPERIRDRRLELGGMPTDIERHVRGGPGSLPPGELGPRVVVVGPGGYPLTRLPLFNRSGVFGAGLITITPEFTRAVRLDRSGVYVQECLEETPAYKAGLRVGDVIMAVGGTPVSTVGDVQSIVLSRLNQGTIGMQVLREKKPITLNVKW